MRHFTIVLAFILLIPVHAVSQVPNPDIQWTADWEVDQDVAIMQVDSESYNFELILEFWINNNRITPIEVNFEVEFEEVEFEVDDPGQVSISGNSNETFEITITGSALQSQSASDDQILYNSDEFRETVSLSLIEMIAGQVADSSRQISQDIEFSKIYDMQVEFETGLDGTSADRETTLKAGTSESEKLHVLNFGNTADAVTKYSISVSRCPQLNYEFSSTGSLPLAVTPAQNSDDSVSFGTLEISATSSHPAKECILEFSVYSEATGYSSYATLKIDVIATEIQAEDDDDFTEVDDDSDASGLDTESSSLPALSSILCVICFIFTALIRRPLQK